MSPLNIRIMDVDKFITAHGCKEVTTALIHEPSLPTFHHDGLFSETIFGAIGTPERFTQHGYINLNCRVFHPTIFQNIQSLKRYHVEIMAGRGYAKWDPDLNDFVQANEDEPGADTGYSFYMRYFPKINWKKNLSLKRNDKIDVLIKYKDLLTINKCLVIPAGIRDMKEEDGRMEKDSINTLYTSLLSSCKAMPPHGQTSAIYDVIHYSVQRKVNDIYAYLLNLVEGKRGFLQGKLGHRSIIGSTRNVITATSLEAENPASPQYHRCDETKVPLYQAAKAYASLVVYQLRALFYSSIISQSTDNVPLIDPVTFKLEYVPIDPKDKDLLVTEEGIQKTIDRFRDPDFRNRPVIAHSDKRVYYLYLVYEEEGDAAKHSPNRIYIFRNLSEFKSAHSGPIDEKKIRPLTYAEMLYTATYYATRNRHCLTVRYPIADEQNIFPARVHLITTKPAKVVVLPPKAGGDEGVILPEWPVAGQKFIDAVMIHPTKLRGLGADFDGDTVSIHPIWTEEANDEAAQAVNDVQNYVLPSGAAVAGIDDLCKITMRAMTAGTPELK